MSLILVVIGAAAFLYGVTIMLIWSGSKFFLVWYALGAVLLAAAWAVHAGLWAAAPTWFRRAIAAFAAFCVAVTCVCTALVTTTMVAEPPAGLHTIIVLGAQVRANGQPADVLRYRLDTAVAYLQENPETKVIVSGGQGPNEPMPEGEAMAAYLQEHGIEPGRITAETKSENTAQNIAFSKELLADQGAEIGIVTNNFHVWRATHLARKQGLNAHGISAYSVPWYLPNNIFREVFGITKDFLVGNL